MKNATLTTFGILTILVIALLFLDTPPNPIDIYALENSEVSSNTIITPRSPAGENIESLLSGENQPVTTDGNQNNLTEKAARSIVNTLLTDETLLESDETAAEKFAIQILESGLSVGADEFNPTIKDSDLTIVRNPNAKNFSDYDDALSAQVSKYFSLPRSSNENFTTASFERSQNETRKIILALYKIPVPENLLIFHKEFLRFLSIQDEAFGNLITFEADPLKAITSVKVIEASNNEIIKSLRTLVQ